MPKVESVCVAEHVFRLLLPGTLCDGRVFKTMCAHWPRDTKMQVADVHGFGDPVVWWKHQLSVLPAQFDVVGFSLGGILAMQLLTLDPARVRRLVLVASNPQPATAAHAERVQAQRLVWQQKGPRALALDLLQQTTAQARQTPELIKVLQDMAEDTPSEAFDAQGQLNASRPDGTVALNRWRGPLLLISGAADPWCGADKQVLIQHVRPDALWHELAEAGHYLPLECPNELARLTEDFLS